MKKSWVIFFSLLGALVLYTFQQALRLLPDHPVLASVLTFFLFVLMFAWQFLARTGASKIDTLWFRVMAWTGSVALGIWATFILFWLPIDLVRDLYGLIRSLRASGSFNAPHFAHVGNWILSGMFILSAGFAGLGLEEALSGPEVKDVSISYPDLPAALEGLKIAVISDLHIGPMIRRGYVEAVVSRLMALQPDLIAVTGDLADGTVDVLAAQVEPLSRLRAPLGVFFITGNHEYYWGVNDWLKKAAGLGFQTLVNENRIVDVKGCPLLVAGITDLTAHHFIPEQKADLDKAIASKTEARFKILLSHRPSIANAAEALGFDLQLSGHTHGGQFFPFSLFIPYFYRYNRGLYHHKSMWVYVNPGTGYWGPPHRFLVSAEITLLRLTGRKDKIAQP